MHYFKKKINILYIPIYNKKTNISKCLNIIDNNNVSFTQIL